MDPSITPTERLFEVCQRGTLEEVQALLSDGASPTAQNEAGFSPLHIVAKREGSVAIAEALLSADAKLESQTNKGMTPLHIAAMTGAGDVMKELLRAGGNCVAKNDKGWTPLHWCCDKNYFDCAELLIQYGADVSARSDAQWSPLHAACKQGFPAIVKLLVDNGADVAALNTTRRTPLHFCRNREYSTECAALLLGADKSTMHAQSNKGFTPLHDAATNNDAALVSFLVRHGAAVDAPSSTGKTPLHSAAIRPGSADTVTTLLELGAQYDATDSTGRTPLHWACQHSIFESVNVLLAWRRTKSDSLETYLNQRNNAHQTALHIAARKWSRRGDSRALVEALLKNGVAVNSPNKEGSTALHLAAGNPDGAELVKLLLDHGASVNTQANDQSTPLLVAIAAHSTDVVSVLLSGAHDVDLELGTSHFTPLLFACEQGATDIALLLINKGADVKATFRDESTALHAAAAAGNKQLVALLLDKGLDVRAQQATGRTALHCAAETDAADVVELLIGKGAMLNATTADDLTPLHIAAAVSGGHPVAVQALLENGADVNEVSSVTAFVGEAFSSQFKVTALQMAILNGLRPIVQMLLSKGATMATDNDMQWSCFHMAVRSLHPHVLYLLLEACNDNDLPLHTDVDGWSPLHHAVYNADARSVELLLTAGCRPTDKTNKGYAALDLAHTLGNQKLVAILQDDVKVEPPPKLDPKNLDPIRLPQKRHKHGGCGEVFAVHHNGAACGIKRDKHDPHGVGSMVLLECSIMSTLHHPHIIQVKGLARDETTNLPIMMMEWMAGGSLLDLLVTVNGKGNAGLPEPYVRRIMKQALEALAYLHQPIHTDPFGRHNMVVVHHDIKPHNMLLSKSLDVLKLADFGLSRFDHVDLPMKRHRVGGTSNYLAPEAKRTIASKGESDHSGTVVARMYTPASDVYSWAQTFVEAASGLYYAQNHQNEAIIDNVYCHLLNHYTVVTDVGKELLQRCLSVDPDDRPSASELLQSPYFNNEEYFEAEMKRTLTTVASTEEETVESSHSDDDLPTAAAADPVGKPSLESLHVSSFSEQHSKKATKATIDLTSNSVQSWATADSTGNDSCTTTTSSTPMLSKEEVAAITQTMSSLDSTWH